MTFIFNKKSIAVCTVSFVVFCASLIYSNINEARRNSSKFYITEYVSVDTVMTTSSLTTAKLAVNTVGNISEAIATAAASTAFIMTTAVKDEPLYININTASADELARLEGIGEKLAAKIIEYRENNGGFNNIEELIQISGIGETIFRNICENIYVENPVYPEYSYYNNEEHNNSDDHLELMSEESEFAPPFTLEDVAPINLNEADVEMLMFLPYVDENIAEKIIYLRESINGFSNVYELLYIEELTREQVSEIIEYVCV